MLNGENQADYGGELKKNGKKITVILITKLQIRKNTRDSINK